MIEIYAVKLCGDEKSSRLRTISAFLSQERRIKIDKFINWQDRERAAVSEMMIRLAAGKKLKMNNKEISFEKNLYGKPSLAGVNKFHFNNSHCGQWVVCAVDNQRIGIDVEEIRTINYDIARNFFCESEFNRLIMKKEEEKLAYFYELWTLKESYIKAEGKGLSIPLDAFEIYKDNESIKVRAKNMYEDYFFKQYQLQDNYRLAACGMHKDFQEAICIKEYHELVEEFRKFADRQ